MRPLDQRSFEVEFVTVVYEEFYVIKTSSEEIDKMIELYYEQGKGTNSAELTLKESKCPLYKSTFIYMMNHEVKLKVLEALVRNGSTTQIGCSTRVTYRTNSLWPSLRRC